MIDSLYYIHNLKHWFISCGGSLTDAYSMAAKTLVSRPIFIFSEVNSLGFLGSLLD